ncbi:hypothetical protein HMPREF9997_00535 [Corynebacterium durum F0235]|uniref:Uncharacterized protein n=1 Tax=Corynebacterium durum F0235 TaxID=1035195 RepID=L1ML58_9CORY|nr:hypothetical protein HMPREF9997_00535 [Corynebacterium durum F0235]
MAGAFFAAGAAGSCLLCCHAGSLCQVFAPATPLHPPHRQAELQFVPESTIFRLVDGFWDTNPLFLSQDPPNS